jgi:hypothetical protein
MGIGALHATPNSNISWTSPHAKIAISPRFVIVELGLQGLAHRIHRTRLEWFDLQLGRADPLRFFHRGEVWNVGNALAETG